MDIAVGTAEEPGGEHHLRLSVVVPAYNVAPYLAECLDSILAQSLRPDEVLVIDDGSTDATATVAREYARSHPRVQVLSTPNHGLGAARNRGVAETSGELIAFADADDIVAPGAYGHLVEALQRSGSDFAVGSMCRLQGDSRVEPRWIRTLHREDRVGVSIEQFPQLLGDVFAWNKVFRRTFWEHHAIAFPEDVRYEDQVAITNAYLRADAVDVIRPVVYQWRIRSDGSAITDARHDLANLTDRVATKRASMQIVTEVASPATAEVFREWVLPGDLWRYFAHIPGCSDAYWDLLQTTVCEFWPDDALERSPLTVANRLVGWLVGRGRRGQATVVVKHAAAWDGHPPKILACGDVIVDLPFWNDPEALVPLRLYRLRDDDLGWSAGLHAVRARDDSLRLDGSAGFDHVELDAPTVRIALTATNGQRSLSSVLPAAGFEAEFDLRELCAHDDVRDAARSWTATVLLEAQSIAYEGPFTHALFQLESAATGDFGVEAAYEQGQLRITAVRDRPLGELAHEELAAGG